jgi:hypothetical protein
MQNFSTVEKIYSMENVFNGYKITLQDGNMIYVPLDTANRHYQEILEWVEKGGVIVDNGA